MMLSIYQNLKLVSIVASLHHRNNVVHGDGKASINVKFLQIYVVSFDGINREVDVKGKAHMFSCRKVVARVENYSV